jgi:WD40 repeat protein/serine/threonine protein kinase
MSAGSTGPAWRLKDLSAAEYSRLSELLDSCLALPPEARTEWLFRLDRKDLRSAEILRRLLATSDAEGCGTLLETGEVLTRHLASLTRGEETLVGRRVGPYRVLSLLGQGGMGSVWLAERADGLFARQVALKLVHPVLMGGQVTERFAREREILAGFSHPHIARLFDAGFTDDGQPFLALQYVAGKPITVYCDERRLTVHERLELFLQVLSAVQYAHAHLIIHRDLKPSNILVTEEGEVQLLDFGIAKLLTAGDAKETELTQVSGRAFTPDYAAPEQIAGEPITTAADVYALGVILYELLTGDRPYRLKRDSRGALEEAILAADPVVPSRVALNESAAHARATIPKRLVRALRGDLDTIVTKALKKSPGERYATANAFGEDIARFLRGDVVVARRDSVAYRALKFTRRHRVGIAVISILMATLTAGLAATTYEAKLAATQRDAALQAQLRTLTQAAAARLKDGDVSSALGIILEVIRHRGKRSYTPESLSVFQEARATDTPVLALTGHGDRVRSAAFSPDGRHAVTASYDKTARIWDVSTGQQTMLLVGHAGRVTSANFSADGRHIVTASVDKTARTWDAATGRQIALLGGHAERVAWAAFSPDGRHVITASDDKTARIWDAMTGRQVLLLNGHTDVVEAGAFSPDGRRVVTASYDKTARIWDAATGGQVLLLNGHTDRVTSAAFSPDGRHVVTASYDKTARVWDATTAQHIALLAGHTETVTTAAFSPDGQRVITASADKTARIWDSASGRQLLVLSGHTDRVTSAAFSHDGLRVITASTDKTARIWDLAPHQQVRVLSGHTELVESAAFSPDGRRVVTGSTDKTARIWDAQTGQQLLVLSGHDDRVTFTSFSPDGRRVVTASFDNSSRIWDSATGQQVALLSGHTDRLWSAQFSSDGRRIVTASDDRTARIWDASTGRPVMLLSGDPDRMLFAAFSPDGQRVVTVPYSKTVRILDAATGQLIMLLNGHTDQVQYASFSANGRRLVTASVDNSARVWDADTGKQILVLTGHRDRVASAAFSPDGRRIVTASDDHTARIWDAATGELTMVLSGHGDLLESAAFSPDGERIVTASDDTTARIWNARTSSLDAQIAWAEAAQFDPLPGEERFQLGLPAQTDIRSWQIDRSKCDQSAAAPYDPDRQAPGIMLDQIAAEIAFTACGAEQGSANTPRSSYQRGRALMASGNFRGARQAFEEALAHGYRAAHLELAMLLSQPSAGMIDVPRTLSLYEQGWHDGVPIAAFELGDLYEYGVSRSDNTGQYLLAPDKARAWTWYRRGADAGEPDALARLGAEADEAAFAEWDPGKSKAYLLEAFKYYAAAAERARTEDWPDDAWRNWRYRRASLARLLACEGMMGEVANVYDGVRRQYSPPPRSLRQRLVSLARSD